MAHRQAQTIGIAFNLKRPADDDTFEEYDEIETIQALRTEITRHGFAVTLLEQNDAFLRRVAGARVDFVVNIAEGRGATRGRESQVPCILESLGIPYSGSDPVALGITLDKYLTGTILRAAGVPVPELHLIRDARDAERLRSMFKHGRQCIVKPRWEGSSKGVFLNSVVGDVRRLREQAALIIRRYRQPAIAEEFLPGDEITAGVCGNDRPRLLGMMRIRPRTPQEEPFIYSLENKHDWETKIWYEPAGVLAPRIRRMVEETALRAFRALELRDIARIDFRVGADGVPAVIDVNPLPGLSPRYSDLPILYRLNGGTYRRLVATLLRESLHRCGFAPRGRRRDASGTR